MVITFTRPGGADSDRHRGRAFDPAAATVGDPPSSARARARTEAGTVLVELYEYFKANAWTHRTLATALPVLSNAILQYRAAQSVDPFDGARSVLAAIERERRSDPTIPEP